MKNAAREEGVPRQSKFTVVCLPLSVEQTTDNDQQTTLYL
jgi:hypothetical protein